MTTPPNDWIMKEIEDLVRLESERALGVFRGRDFASGLTARLKAEEAPSRPPLFFRKLLVPVLGLAVLAAAGLALFLLRSPGPSASVAGLSALHAVIEMYGRPDPGEVPFGALARPGGDDPRASDDWIINRALALLVPELAEEDSGLSSGTADGPAPRFSRRERIRILFKDRAIERVFMKIHTSDKEA
ncbi:MAG: hypothetical protein SCM96_05205 [Acidobacteriota bacterium]|nr:hypothetical protein [Acidobacteriota bacterium]